MSRADDRRAVQTHATVRTSYGYVTHVTNIVTILIITIFLLNQYKLTHHRTDGEPNRQIAGTVKIKNETTLCNYKPDAYRQKD